ncbi:MAG: hypothetical protein AAFN92_02200 [Bacteroidota bacterium]
MPVKDRTALRSLFKEGYLPAKSHYDDLIDSMLNRKEDQFFGKWVRGKRYCQGDVVLFGKSLYLLDIQPVVTEIICADDADTPVQETSVQTKGGKEEAPKGCICSETEPPNDVNWCELELAVDDRDWEILLDEESGDPLYVYQVKAAIGIGTDRPATRLEVAGPGGQLRLDPDGDYPTLSLHRTGEPACHVRWVQGEQTEFVTDSLGYALFRGNKPGSSKTEKAPDFASGAPTPLPREPQLILFLTTEEERPRAGIGTDDPQGVLHVEDEQQGRLLVNPQGGKDAANVLLIDLRDAGNNNFLLSAVDQRVAWWQTDASDGMRFRVGGKVDGDDHGLSAVAIRANGFVGIGTEEPRSKLEVTEADMGTIRLDFGQDNVCLSTINERPDPEYPRTYLSLGVDESFGTLVTDAPKGYVFKAGRPHGTYDAETDINQGDIIAYLGPEGKLGLRTAAPPENYDLHVSGHQLGQTAYLATNGKLMEKDGDLDVEETLKKFSKLKPMYFKWLSAAHASENGDGDKNRHLGFKASNVFEAFPELTRGAGPARAVAYGNLTAVLTLVIQEQQKQIEDLDRRLCALEGNND